VSEPAVTTHSDARIRWYDGLVYVVNRFGQDNIQVLDPAQGYATVRQFSVGNGSNPQDIAFVSPTKAYVTRLASSRLLIVNPSTGDSIGAIPLGAFADGDGLPEMDRTIVVGSRLFVSCERLQNFQPSGASLVVAIDTGADTVLDARPDLPGTQAITLPAGNSATAFDWDPSSRRLLIGCTGAYGVADGGIVWIDPVTLATGGYAITESALGGDVLDVVWYSPTRSFAIVNDAAFNTSLVAWDPSTGHVTGTLLAPGGFSLSDATLDDRGELYVCENDLFAPGVHVLSAATGAALHAPLATSLPPVEVAFDRAASSLAGVPSRSVTPGLALSAPWPQPAGDVVRMRLQTPGGAAAALSVLDATGRSVRSLGAVAGGAGTSRVAWDVRDDGGHRVSPGVYTVFARSGDATSSQRIIVIR